jgi:glucosamine-phosphate N-acetyltransferase
VSQIRECCEADFDQILLLLKQLWPSRELDPAALLFVYSNGLASAAQRYICAVENGRVVGFCSLTLKNNLWQAGYVGHIDELIVDVHYRGRGIGTALLARISQEAVKSGCSRIELDSAFHRKEAHQFYAAHGFENRAYLFSKTL